MRAVIVQIFDPRYFEVCSECGKKTIEGKCSKHENGKSIKRALLNIVLDDGSDSVRGVMFGQQINLLGLDDTEIFSLEKFLVKKRDLLGEERLFSGSLRNNQVFNTNEFNIESIENLDPQKLIQELEKR